MLDSILASEHLGWPAISQTNSDGSSSSAEEGNSTRPSTMIGKHDEETAIGEAESSMPRLKYSSHQSSPFLSRPPSIDDASHLSETPLISETYLKRSSMTIDKPSCVSSACRVRRESCIISLHQYRMAGKPITPSMANIPAVTAHRHGPSFASQL